GVFHAGGNQDSRQRRRSSAGAWPGAPDHGDRSRGGSRQGAPDGVLRLRPYGGQPARGPHDPPDRAVALPAAGPHGDRAGGRRDRLGDPSGGSEERRLLPAEEAAANVARLRDQISHFLTFDGPNPAILANNIAWLGAWSLTEFLRDIGKHFTVNAMLAKESVR